MRLILITLITLAGTSFGVFGQSAPPIDLDHFTTLRSSGLLPEDFTVRSSEKFARESSDVVYDSKRERKDKETFLLESNFQIEEMLHSGRIVFGDTITSYLNAIKDVILKNNPSLSPNIRIYTLLSNDVNAFTFDNGIVIVTTGLLAQVQNEAQLAYILCHEFVHFKYKHAITGYVESRRVERGAGVYASLSRGEEDLAKFRFAKEQETEADEEGLALYRNTPYSLQALQGVFDVLLYSYLPINDIVFPKEHFNDGFYVLPSTAFLDTVQSITAEEDYNDEQHTHPNIRKRKENVMSRIPEPVDSTGTASVVGEETFNYIQKVARFQGCALFLMDVQYEEALYQAFILQQEYPDNPYLQRVVARSLYSWANYKNAGTTPDDHRYYKKIEGESQQVYHLFHKLNTKEFTILALRETWKAHLQQPEDPELLAMSKDLGYLLAIKHELDADDFLTTEKIGEYALKLQQQTDSLKTAPPPTEQKKENKPTKTQKIKEEKNTKSESEEKTPYWKFAYGNFVEDETFRSLLKITDNGDEEVDDRHSTSTYTISKIGLTYHLGLKEVVLVDPVFISIDERSKNPIEYMAAEESREYLHQVVETGAADLGLDVTYLDHSDLERSGIQDLNNIAILSRWMHEELAHMGNDVDMINSTSAELKTLSDKLGVEHFAWMGVVSFTEKEKSIAAKIVLAFYPLLTPFMIYNLVTPDQSTFYFTLVANGQTGDLEMVYYTVNTLNNSKSTHASNIYYILQQIKTPRK